MRNNSLEQFYRKINRRLLMVGGYLGDKTLPTIFKACRLKPLTVFYKNLDARAILEPIWIDEFNYTVEIKNKKIKLGTNSVIEQYSTDIYKYSDLKFLIERSRIVLVGLLPSSLNFVVVLLGSDNYVRVYRYVDNQLQICSSLTIGIKLLRYLLFARKPEQGFKRVPIRPKIKNLEGMEWWISSLPISDKMIPQFEKYTQLRNILYSQ